MHVIIKVIINTQVYLRLQKLGVCLPHTATLLAIKRMGLNHDKPVLDWKNYLSGKANTCAESDVMNPNDEDGCM